MPASLSCCQGSCWILQNRVTFFSDTDFFPPSKKLGYRIGGIKNARRERELKKELPSHFVGLASSRGREERSGFSVAVHFSQGSRQPEEVQRLFWALRTESGSLFSFFSVPRLRFLRFGETV